MTQSFQNESSSDFKTYLFSYRFRDERWSIDLQATSPQEAKDRLAALAFAQLDGELKARVAIAPTFVMSLIRRFKLW